MAAALLAAMLGLLGPGPLSHRVAETTDRRLRIEYARFVRYSAPSELRIEVRPAASNDRELRVSFSRSFSDIARIEQIVPEPVAIEGAESEAIYVFAIQRQTPVVPIVIHYQYQGFGRFEFEVKAGGESVADIRQFVFP